MFTLFTPDGPASTQINSNQFHSNRAKPPPLASSMVPSAILAGQNGAGQTGSQIGQTGQTALGGSGAAGAPGSLAEAVKNRLTPNPNTQTV